MNERTRKYGAWVLVVIAILVAGYFGVSYPIPEPPTMLPAQAVTNCDILGTFSTFSDTIQINLDPGNTGLAAPTIYIVFSKLK